MTLPRSKSLELLEDSGPSSSVRASVVELRYPLPKQAFVAFPAHEVVACASGHSSDVAGEVLDDGGRAEGGHDEEDADYEGGRVRFVCNRKW